MERTFSLKFEQGPEEKPYKKRIIEIINSKKYAIAAPDVHPHGILHKELHEERSIDSLKEVNELRSVREDICDAFGVTPNDHHIYILENDPEYKVSNDQKQRAVRAFYVLLDLLNNEGFYGEGRTAHNILLNKLISKAKQEGIDDATIENVIENIDADPPRWIVFKGFLDKENFNSLSEHARESLEEPIEDGNGKIETPKSWFISGSSLPSV